MTPSLLAAMQLTDSALPIGAFSHSLGFESYIEAGIIHDEASFAAWLHMFGTQQLTFTDALAIRLVYAATDFAEVMRIDAALTAQALPHEIRQAGVTMGQRLLTIAAESYDSPWLAAYQRAVADHLVYAHPASVWAVVAKHMSVEADDAVAHHVYATVISLTQNAVRGVPLGQQAGQRVIRQAQDWVQHAVEASKQLDESDLGAIAPGLEIAQMRHEQQRARLFMS